MRLAVWVIVPSAILLLAAAFALQFRHVKGTFSTSNISIGLCQANQEIPRESQEEISSAALGFVDLFARSPMEARNEMSVRGRAATPRRDDIETASVQYRSMRGSATPVVTDMYLLKFSSGSDAGLRVPCDFREGRAVFVGRGGTLVSAVVLLTHELPGASETATSVWLEREGGEWRVRAINFGPSRISGLDSEQLWSAAREQRSKGHLLNATMLYAAARSTQRRVLFYQARVVQDFDADMRTFEAPDILRGEPPFRWTFGNETFAVRQVQYMGVGDGDVALIIDHAPSSWSTHEEAEAVNRRLIDGVNAAYPEWREIFDAVVARAAKPGSNETWGTVFSRANGYSEPASRERQSSSIPEPR